MDSFQSQIWAYLHNELPAEKRAQFEWAAGQDPALEQEIDACRAVHHDLEDWGDQLLEKELLAKWESEHPEYQEGIRRRRRMIPLSIPVAAAAALVLGLTLQLHRGPIRWERTFYGRVPQLRGESVAEPVYSPDDLKQTSSDLRETVEERLADDPSLSE